MVREISVVNDGNVVKTTSAHQQLNNEITNGEYARSSVLHRSLHHDPIRVELAKGNFLHLSNGQKIFDATGGAAVACLGHGNER